ncbi:MAG: hypothetical protein E4H27_10075 [Anaerolineales bacterium]|nr:MAG: hypothetical protein E4H27_10075 [Anaerolineales bacterium]
MKTALIGAGGRDPVRILEIGGGIGTMLYRMLADGVLSRASYTLIDGDPENIRTAAARLPQWLNALGLETASRPEGLFIYTPVIAVDAELETVELYDFIDREAGQEQWDLIVGHAALDYLDVPRLLPELCSLAYPGALLYFTINFDGLTAFEPVLDPVLDDLIISLYHLTLDEHRVNGCVSGDSHTGRRLFTWLENAGLKILDAGSSDYVVFPKQERYTGDEAYYLHFIIRTVEDALKDHPELDGARLAEWAAARHKQIERAELSYISHQMDFLAQVSA